MGYSILCSNQNIKLSIVMLIMISSIEESLLIAIIHTKNQEYQQIIVVFNF